MQLEMIFQEFALKVLKTQKSDPTSYIPKVIKGFAKAK